LKTLTPRETLAELDRFIVGQHEAKKAVALAVRNRWRRQQLDEKLRQEVLPKNIIMSGPTGVGKTEIARRLAGLVNAPFIKVEATRYTEVGYHGRDVETMIRDLVEIAISMVRAEQFDAVKDKVEKDVEERILDLLLPPPDMTGADSLAGQGQSRTREKMRAMLKEGKFEDRVVEIVVTERPMVVQGAMIGTDDVPPEMQNMLERMIPPRRHVRKMTVGEARRVLEQEEAEKYIDRDRVSEEAIRRTEDSGIVFLDEVDKIAGAKSLHGPDVSREGVQRDLLPIVEGTTVSTRHGLVRTDHILFIAAGAFHMSKPSDLIPELQGRFPIRVELRELGVEEFKRILVEPENSLTVQYKALLATEGVEIQFEPAAIDRLAELSVRVNESTENIGARRLQTLMEKLLEDVSFEAPEKAGTSFAVTAQYVEEKLRDIVKDEDLSRFIL